MFISCTILTLRSQVIILGSIFEMLAIPSIFCCFLKKIKVLELGFAFHPKLQCEHRYSSRRESPQLGLTCVGSLSQSGKVLLRVTVDSFSLGHCWDSAVLFRRE